MRKMYRFDNVDCAHCAQKVQEAIKKVDGVRDCVLNFLAQKMVLEFDLADKEKVVAEIIKAARKVVPDFELLI